MLELRPALSGAWRGRVCAVDCQDPVKNIEVVMSNGRHIGLLTLRFDPK